MVLRTRRGAVLGSPVLHSLSPVLHRAACAALGLAHWRYDAIECDDLALPPFVGGLGPEWAGLSVTMPGKRAALEVADSVTPTAAAVGAADTLVHGPDGGWLADCTGVDGILGALAARGVAAGPAVRSAVVLGAGCTAQVAIVALARLGASSLTVIARSALRATDAVACAARVGLPARVGPWPSAEGLPLLRGDLLVGAVPAGVIGPASAEVLAAGFPVVLDVSYPPWPARPTPLASAVPAAGGLLATGLDVLLHQAFGQVEHFTRRPAPREAMRSALRSTVGPDCPPLPL